jgi:G3E family GTPase
VEFADVIILNKADLVSERDSGELKAIITSFNPDLKVLNPSFSITVHSVLFLAY